MGVVVELVDVLGVLCIGYGFVFGVVYEEGVVVIMWGGVIEVVG